MNFKTWLDRLVNKSLSKNFSSLNYVMKKEYNADVLVIGKLEQISPESCVTHKRTSQYYIFEPILVNDKLKYQEVFTGFIAGDSHEGYFNLPYVVCLEKLTDLLVDCKHTYIPKLGMLLLLNDVNLQMIKCDDINSLKKA